MATSRTTFNLLDDYPPSLPEELVTLLVESRQVRIERIVSAGHATPAGFWYDQDEHEWVLVLSGEATLRFENDATPVHLTRGDHVLIPAHKRHRVEWTHPAAPTVWLAVFYRE